MRKTKLFTLFLAITLLVVITACNKEKENEDNTPTSTTATLKIKLIDGGYGTISNIEIYLSDNTGNLIQKDETNTNGELTFKDILEGTYYIEVDEAGYFSNHFQLISGQTKTLEVILE